MDEALRLGDHCTKIGSGATPRGGKETYSDDGPISLIRSQNVHNDRFSYRGLAYISHEQAAQLQNVEVQEGDVLLNITGDSVARVCQVDRAALPARVNQLLAIIRPSPERIDARFLRYFLVTPKMQSHMLGLAASGATRNALTKSMIEGFLVPAWGILYQRAIAEALGALDDKIELNRRMNETLERIAQAIFRDWFVDFGPTRRKLAGIADPIEIMGGLVQDPARAAKLAALFPAALGDNGLPQGWERRTLSECANVLSGGTPSKGNAAYWGGEIPWISPKVMTGIHVDEADDHITEQAVSEGAKLVPIGATLVMVRGMGLHDGMRVSQARREVTFNQDVKAFVAKRDVPADFLFWGILALAPEIHGKVESSGHGTGKLPSDRLLSATLAVPSADAIRELSKMLTLLNERIDLSRRESNTLAATRDLLLPKLMSGEIRLRDADATAGASS